MVGVFAFQSVDMISNVTDGVKQKRVESSIKFRTLIFTAKKLLTYTVQLTEWAVHLLLLKFSMALSKDIVNVHFGALK